MQFLGGGGNAIVMRCHLVVRCCTAADAARLAEWEFHNAVLAMKEVVKGQFGSDSDEAQSIGLKKKSDRKRPTRQRMVAVAG